ncbi:OmpA family protein, partial [Acidisphaera rubrifaciens]|uniref:OmpA family protein n=1 Tax=Acidisphaera rubrifaciens TaxID=50715 RepID=UPI0006627C3F
DRPPATPIPQPTTAPLSAAQEQQRFTAAASAIADAVRADPALAPLARQLSIDTTPEGLRIQILDEAQQPMFATGSAVPNERARLLLRKVAPVLAGLTEQVSIAGYTDAAPYPGPDRTNWELSADRANATRRLLVDAGLADRRIRGVVGHADHDLLLPHQPLAAANRRIAIVVLREAPAPAAAPAAASAP